MTRRRGRRLTPKERPRFDPSPRKPVMKFITGFQLPSARGVGNMKSVVLQRILGGKTFWSPSAASNPRAACQSGLILGDEKLDFVPTSGYN